MANQGLHARQTARPSRDEQNIATVVRDRLTDRMKRGGERELTRQHRVLHLPEMDVQRYAEQINVFRASRQCMVDRLLEVIHHVTRRFLREQIAKGGMQPGQRIVNIACFPRGQDRVADRHKELKRRLLAQYRLGINPPGVAEEGCHQLWGIGYAGFLKMGLQRGQYVALDHVQQRIVASTLEPFADQ